MAEYIVDRYCDPEEPYDMTFDEIYTAYWFLKDEMIPTPCTLAENFPEYNMEIFLKKEFMQATGSFKDRGARYALTRLYEEHKQNGVISASTGNHALALSYQGCLLNIPVTVVVPISTASTTIERCRSYNAHVITQGRDLAESRVYALTYSNDKQLEYIDGYDHPNIIAGNGTTGLELLKQIPSLDAIVVPVGGGGLIAAIAKSVKRLSSRVKIIGVELENCPSFRRAIDNGGPVYTEPKNSLAEGLLVPQVGYNAFATAGGLIDKLVSVTDDWVAFAMLRLVMEEECVVEGAGAVGFAAIMAGYLSEFHNKRVVVVLSGGNTYPAAFGRALELGISAERRLSPDIHSLLPLIETLKKIRFNLNDLMAQNSWFKSAYSSALEQHSKVATQELMLPELKKSSKDNEGDEMQPTTSARSQAEATRRSKEAAGSSKEQHSKVETQELMFPELKKSSKDNEGDEMHPTTSARSQPEATRRSKEAAGSSKEQHSKVATQELMFPELKKSSKDNEGDEMHPTTSARSQPEATRRSKEAAGSSKEQHPKVATQELMFPELKKSSKDKEGDEMHPTTSARSQPEATRRSKEAAGSSKGTNLEETSIDKPKEKKKKFSEDSTK